MYALKIISSLGSSTIRQFKNFGEFWVFIAQTFTRSFSKPFYFDLLIRQIYVIGAQSITVVGLVGAFTGMVLAVQGVYTLSQFGATAYTGSAVALSLIRELGPVLTALMVNGRAGSAMTAELGIMKITEQVDALYSMSVDPKRYLIVPRMIAGLISVPLLTAIFIVIGIGGGYLIGTTNLGLSSGTFMAQMIQSVKPIDIYSGLIKSLVFGFSLTAISCFKGWNSGLGAVGVNQSTTSSVVTSSVTILIVDYFLTTILTQLF